MFRCIVEGTGGGIIGPLRAGPDIDIRPVFGLTTEAGTGRPERAFPKSSPGGCIVDLRRKSPIVVQCVSEKMRVASKIHVAFNQRVSQHVPDDRD